ncbi:FAD dependent oxidoreductase [Paenibacillus sp. SYP-B3998]|uniref:FAD dependent oxidoreductase n=1 Tax=Paenibacillus sp. SYP-B3998 TaxID=2678564 RepID=A0A6G3ZSX5_9BACL|nr:FAD dependent oxidoreductase [Paenibacillus sp. SYP-B3998]NEW04804.1 FAD dependent oxidoreductase [Paenibacillus sp. SYP-B3998]
MKNNLKEGKAIVIGGSIAGLLSARVLSDYYTEVFIVERDELPEGPVNRAGTPHSFHPHRLTPRAKKIIDRLFPGYNDDLLANGASSSLNKSLHMMNEHGSIVLGPNAQNHATNSRALLEWVFRKRVQRISNVHFLVKRDVLGLQATPDRTQVTGVILRERGGSGKTQILLADRVLDTSGRSSQIVEWLQNLGYDVPQPDLLKVALGYSTRHYKVPPAIAENWDTIRIEGDPSKGSYTGVFSMIENQLAEVMLYRPGGQYPPTKVEDFEKEVAQLASPLIAEVLQGLEPIDTPRGYRLPACFRHHFEIMQRWPSGFLVLGDAFCNFDPIFAQGMTVVALEVEMLEGCLQEQRQDPRLDFERNVIRKMQEVVEPAWWLNCVADLRWSGVEYVGSEPLRGIAFAQKYLDLFLKLAMSKENSQMYGLYWLVSSASISPRELINPQMISNILAADGSDEAKQFLNEFLQGNGQSLDDFLNQILPT